MKNVDKKLPDLWIEGQENDPCPCCNWVSYMVFGWDRDGDWSEHGPYLLREDAVEKIKELGGIHD